MGRKRTFEEVKELIYQKNPRMKLLSIEYVNYNTKMKFECEQGHIFEMDLGHFLRRGKCPFCGGYNQTTKSFKSMVESNNDNIEVIGEYVNAYTKIKCHCKIHNYDFEDVPIVIKSFKSCCPIGGRELRDSNTKKFKGEQFQDRLIAIGNNDIEVLEDYISAKTPILVRCKNCGREWKTTPNTLLSGGGCIKCKLKKFTDSLIMTNEEFIAKLSDISDNSITPLEHYVKSNIKILCKCNVCGNEWRVVPNSLMRGTGCPNCNRRTSHLQKKVDKFLKEMNIPFNREFDCSIVPHNPKTGNAMPFDNEIVGMNLLLEIDGEQHERITPFTYYCAEKHGITPEEELKRRKLYDRYKEYVAYKNGYEVLRISWKLEKDDKFKEIIINKINEIKERQCK